MRSLPLLAFLLLVGCATPEWVHRPVMSETDFTSWFERENLVQVEEIAQAQACNTAGGETEVNLMPDLATLKGWAADRGVELVSPGNKAFPETAYAVVEFGQREHSGYGVAISRQAALKNSTLLLKGTFFEPQPGRWSSADPSSPCAVVALPPREFRNIKVIDQSGKVRAAFEGRDS